MKRYRFLFLITALAGCDQSPDVDPPPVASNEASVPTDAQRPVTQGEERETPWGKATRYGLLKQRTKGRIVENPDASTGKIIRGSTLEFVGDDTQRIPVQKDVRFGYRYWIKLPPDERRPSFRRVLIHPEMTLPDGSKVTRSEQTIRKRSTHGIVTAIDAYALSEDYELVAGDWIFQIWYEDKLVVEQKFTSFWPDSGGTG